MMSSKANILSNKENILINKENILINKAVKMSFLENDLSKIYDIVKRKNGFILL